MTGRRLDVVAYEKGDAHRRLSLGQIRNASRVILFDAKGRRRIELSVVRGVAKLRFFDEKGKVVRSVP